MSLAAIDQDRSIAPTIAAPTINALFLARFDLKKGTTLEWSQAKDDALTWKGVEDKAIPSGLHHVHQDLVYFTHGDDYTGLSVFWNEPSDAASRNAKMFAVGVMLQCKPGRLGRLWTHVEALQKLAGQIAKQNREQASATLQRYWHDTEAPWIDQSDTKAQTNSKKIEMPIIRNQPRLSSHHPALSILNFLDMLGPLVFPLHRAALLGQRILFMTDAPIALACNYVYILSLISNFPDQPFSSPSHVETLQRTRPLYCVGVHDIPTLEKLSTSNWIACTTDRIMTSKPNLWDLLIILPSPGVPLSSEPVQMRQPDNAFVKATQRDLRRYNTLRSSIAEHISQLESKDILTVPLSDHPGDVNAGNDIRNHEPLDIPQPDNARASASVEPYAWTALAYNSYVWWASAGEAGAELDEERLTDQDLFCDTSIIPSAPASPRLRRASTGASSRHSQRRISSNEPIETAVLAYFRRLTAVLIEAIDRLISSQTGSSSYHDEPENQPDLDSPAGALNSNTASSGEPRNSRHEAENRLTERSMDPSVHQTVRIETHDFTDFGLDIWNRNDHIFVQRFCQRYFAVVADVKGGVIECCGLRFR